MTLQRRPDAAFGRILADEEWKWRTTIGRGLVIRSGAAWTPAMQASVDEARALIVRRRSETAPIVWGDHAPVCTCKSSCRGDHCGCWGRWQRQPVVGAIGQPAPQESTAAFERRVLVLGERLDGRIAPTRVRQ